MKRKISIILMAVVLMLSFVACQNKEEQKVVEKETITEQTTDITTEENNEDEVVTVDLRKDRAGNEIIIPEEITSIISLAPSITEILVDLGEADKLVAIDTTSSPCKGVPEGLIEFDLMNPDIEKIIELNPSVLLVSGLTTYDGQKMFPTLEELGISIICIPTSQDIEGIFYDITYLGALLEKEQQASDMIVSMQQDIDKIKEIGSTITDKKSVLFEISAAPYIYSFGSGVYLTEMLEIIGATNVLSEQEGWLSVENEAAVNSNPDVILTNVNYIENPTEEIKGRDGWGEVNAVKNNEVYYIDNMTSSLPNHNIVKALEEMAKAIYPEYY